MPNSLYLSVADLPPTPEQKKGWPWKLNNQPTSFENSHLYPKISVVTPNYNYGHYLEETIRSVLLQGYPNLEYIIMDGGSTDNSIEIIKKYEPWITYWESQPDRGQTHAINKGLERATGEVFNWINSDDILAPGALFAIAQGIQNYDAFAGIVNNFDETGNQAKVFPQNITPKGLLTRFNTSNKPSFKDTVYHQPGFWFRTEALKKVGNLNENLNVQFDFDRVVRYLHHYPKVNYSDQILVDFRCHSEQKTAPDKVKQEGKYIVQSLLSDPQYEALHEPAKLWLSRLLWYENIAETLQTSEMHRATKIFNIFLLSCRNPKAYWTRYTFGSIHQLLIGKY